MIARKGFIGLGLSGLLLMFILGACMRIRMTPPGSPIPESQPLEAEVTPSLEVSVARPTPSSLDIPKPPISISSPSMTSSSEPGRVTISAVGGNLFVRRGPDMSFNPIAVLYEGQHAIVLARDVLADWVQIPLPNQTGGTGWVSIQTRFSVIEGDVKSLPQLAPTEWPIPAYLANCTYHQMMIDPGDIVLPSLLEYPENEMWLYPGIYNVYDLEVAGHPEVATVEMREGIQIEIRVDGNNEKRKCP
jgi:hypothetical protein